jgi:hypothetical protein
MPEFLKGNYKLRKDKGAVTRGRARSKKDLTDQFEEVALAKLGGSLCFVMRKGTFIWNGKGDEAAGETAH